MIAFAIVFCTGVAMIALFHAWGTEQVDADGPLD
jgi:hypothetical protein